MNEEQVETVAETVQEQDPQAFIQAAAESADQVAEAEKTDKQAPPDGYQQVEFTPEQKARFDRVYGQVKSLQRESSQYKSVMAEQAKVIEDLSNGVGMIANHLQGKSYEETEGKLQTQMQSAWEAGDTKTFFDLQTKLTDIKVDQKLAALNKQQKQPQAKPQTPQEPQARPYLAADFEQAGAEAVNEGDISAQEQSVLNAWAAETNERGAVLRPWIKNSTGDPNNPDPDYVKAWVVANQVLNNPQLEHLSFDQKLLEIDKKMGIAKSSAGQTVMGGRFTTKPKAGKISLSPEVEKYAEQIAKRTRFGGPKKSEAESVQAYRDQIARVQSKRRGSQ